MFCFLIHQHFTSDRAIQIINERENELLTYNYNENGCAYYTKDDHHLFKESYKKKEKIRFSDEIQWQSFLLLFNSPFCVPLLLAKTQCRRLVKAPDLVSNLGRADLQQQTYPLVKAIKYLLIS